MSKNSQALKVLVAWSPDASGSEQLEVAAWLGRTTTILLRCVTTVRRPWPSPAFGKAGNKYQKWLKKEGARCEKTLRSELSSLHFDPSQQDRELSLLADGTNEALLLTQAADDYGADLIVLGAAAASPKGRFLPGTTADALLHSSPRPLILAPRSPKLSKRGITRLTVAHVGDENFAATAVAVARFAAEWGASLRILTVSPEGFGDSTPSHSLALPSDLTLQWRENTMAGMDRLSDTIHELYPDTLVETEIASGPGWAGALDAVKWKKGDMLCLGSTPLGALERVFIGSQAIEILPFVKVPVLIIPALKEGEEPA